MITVFEEKIEDGMRLTCTPFPNKPETIIRTDVVPGKGPLTRILGVAGVVFRRAEIAVLAAALEEVAEIADEKAAIQAKKAKK